MGERLRVVLLGSTGNGKSATGNSMLGEKIFESHTSASSVTSECQVEYNSQLVVVDTPGFFDTRNTNFENEIRKCVTLSAPGPHAFLLVLTPGRFTECDQKVVDSIKTKFGPGVVDFIIIAFVRKDEICAEISCDQFIATCPDSLKCLIKECGYRYVFIENKPKKKDKTQTLVNFIRRKSKNGELYYTNKMYEKAEAEILRVEEEIQNNLAKERAKQLQMLSWETFDETECQRRKYLLDEEFEEKLRNTRMDAKKKVAATVVVAGGLVGVAVAATALVGPGAVVTAAVGLMKFATRFR